jgi:acetolactate synthase-1/2/3 large subunit
MTAVEIFVQSLRDYGIDWISTLCGHGLDPLYHAAAQSGIRLVDTRNEQTAGYIAEASGRLTRSPGVCAVSSGVAHVNALSGVLNAWFDAAPMLLVSGSGALRTAGLGHFQDVDQVAIASPITRFARTIDTAERVTEILGEAFRRALGPPTGPVHLTFPMDIQKTVVTPERLISPRLPQPDRCISDVEPVALALAGSEQPLIVAGSGVWYGDEGEELMRFCERFSIPVVVPIWDRGSISRPITGFMGVIGAASGGPKLFADADCVVLAGAEPDYRLGFLQAPAIRDGAGIVRMHNGWRSLSEAYAKRGGKSHSAWRDEAAQRRDNFRQDVLETGERQARGGLHAIHIIRALKHVMTDETVLLIDGGSIGQWCHQLLCDRYPGHWLTCGRSGVVGWGIGGAMAARLVYPDRPIILLSGDGAFTFTISDLECAVRQKLHFVAIIADDQGWGITRTGHLEQFGRPISSSLGPIAFDRIAEGLGAHGSIATTPEGLRNQLVHALEKQSVTVIHAPIVGGNPSVDA